MKRWVWSALLLLLLGAVINVAVAWGCAAFSRTTKGPGVLYHAGAAAGDIVPPPPDWLVDLGAAAWIPDPASRSFRLGNAAEESEAGFGLRFAKTRLSFPAEEGALGIEDLGCELYSVRAGWPAIALASWIAHDVTWQNAWDARVQTLRKKWVFSDGPPPAAAMQATIGPATIGPGDWKAGVPAPLWLDSGRVALFSPYAGPRILPLRPLPVGVAINTAFYGGLAWLVSGGAVLIRGYIRSRRGQCRACGYPIGVSAVCSECGKAVRARAGATA